MRKQRWRQWQLPPWLFFSASLVAVLLGDMVASLLYDSLNLWWQGQAVNIHWPGLILIGLFLLLTSWLYQQGKMLFRPRTRSLRDEPARPSKHLVLFLSNLAGELTELTKTNGVSAQLPLKFQEIGEDLNIMKQEKKTARIFWAWEMPLRAMWEHAEGGTLEDVTFICSSKSLPQLPLFIKNCKRYPQFVNLTYFVLVRLADNGQLIAWNDKDDIAGAWQGWDFERFDHLSEALWDLLDEFEGRGFLESDIMIDFTGGKKVISVAAALITYNRQVKAQYVDTETCRVLSYDIVIPTPAKGMDF